LVAIIIYYAFLGCLQSSRSHSFDILSYHFVSVNYFFDFCYIFSEVALL